MQQAHARPGAETSVSTIEDAFKTFTSRDDVAVILITQTAPPRPRPRARAAALRLLARGGLRWRVVRGGVGPLPSSQILAASSQGLHAGRWRRRSGT